MRRDDGFQLKFIFGGVPAALHIHFCQKVGRYPDCVSSSFQPGFQSEPEIREFIVKRYSCPAYCRAKFQAPTSSVSGSFSNGFDKTGNIRRNAVRRIDGDGIAETFFFCLGKTMLQSGSLFLIPLDGVIVRIAGYCSRMLAVSSVEPSLTTMISSAYLHTSSMTAASVFPLL